MSPGKKTLTDCPWQMIGRAVSGELNHPALVNLKGGLEDVLLIFRETIQMLNRAFMLEDRAPDFIRVGTFFFQQFFQRDILHRERTGQGFVRVDICRDRLNARGSPAANDGD